MTDRELLADLLDSSVIKARKRLKETGQIENKDVIPLVLHDYHGRFDSIDKQLNQINENHNELVELFNSELMTKNEFKEHMTTLDQRLQVQADAFIISMGSTERLVKETKWVVYFVGTIGSIIFALLRWLPA
jgi:uncharacterized protein YqgQ